MKNNICHKFLHFLLFVFSLLPLLKITASTSISHRLQAATTHYKCISNERDSLLDFKAHLQDYSGILSTWTSEDRECCKWNGVTCNNQTGHVTRLDLSSLNGGFGLEGEISPSLLNLSYLSYLDLSGNSFYETVPMFIGSMTWLSYLDLSDNSFSGTIHMFNSSMTQLSYLDLSSNLFSGIIPTSMGSLPKLTSLHLSHNCLLNGSCIPQELGNLTNLKELSLGHLESCRVENIDWLSHMPDLTYLNVDGLSLAKINKWVNVILYLRKLSYLSLQGCELSQVMYPYSPSFFNTSSSIVTLYLYDNNLNSSMYHWLLPLTNSNLRSLDLSKNMLDGKSLGNLCSLASLSINYNSFVVKLPDFLNNWSGCTSVALQSLYASYSQFKGSLSDDIHMFSSLEYMRLDHNELNGSISEKVWEIPKLQIFDISSNYLSGTISENIGKSKLLDINLSNNSLKGVLSEARMLNLSYATFLDMSTCNLGPRFPKWIQNFKNLTRLNIANSRIFDATPVEFWNNWPSQLTYLNLSTNNMSGEVPDLVSNIDPTYYSTIDLSSNNFYGDILDVPSASSYLDISRNNFHGGISFLCQISDGGLRYLDVSHNSFTGKLPDCLWHFKGLKVLNLGHNNLFGRLPASIEFFIGLEVFSLYNNNFSGELPLSLKNCSKLTFLDLGSNKFTGNVPIWIGENLPGLYVLSLRSNKFLGHIPFQLCQLANLQILDLSMNKLYGTIPTCVNNLTSMVQGVLYEPNVHNVRNLGPREFMVNYVDNAMFHWQGNIREFSTILVYLKGIYLSRNNLIGQIPYELTDLHELVVLNLSNNALHGKIPWKIGEMRKLLALDLSRNNLSGELPSSMSHMNLLNDLDVSYNNLFGRIPSSTQLQSFEPSRYTGNAKLCGLPLPKHCPGDDGSKVPPLVGKSEDDRKKIDELWRWFYIGCATGFPIGFWIVCGILFLSRRARHAFFQFLDSLQNMVYVEVVVFVAKLKRFACK